jgi:hypothetical protein
VSPIHIVPVSPTHPHPHLPSNDALRRHGILPPLPPTPRTPSPPPSPPLTERLAALSVTGLRAAAEDARDDETYRTAEALRLQRATDAQREVRLARFGLVYPISREDYTREVTEASAVDEAGDDDERGTGVVCFLYKDG